MVRLVALYFLFFTSASFALNGDDKLQMVVDLYNLKPETCNINQSHVDNKLTGIGDILFNTKSLSGDGDTSCATCHLDSKFLTDGLPLAIGVGGGDAEGKERIRSSGVVVPRNVFTLFGRANKDFDTFFWDGKVTELEGKVFSPIGSLNDSGFKSAFSLATVLPILARDEFLGKQHILVSNKHVENINSKYYRDKIDAFNILLQEKLQNSADEDFVSLRKELKSQNIELNRVDLALIGSSLASFIAEKTKKECAPSPWDLYLTGDQNSITEVQKEGAIIFFGKGRCSSCHSGGLFSDFNFHSLGVPQGEYGTHIHRQDIGHAEVTFKTKDRFKFRTPPLLGVSKTAPYGHSGVFNTLEEVVLFHINPVLYFSRIGWTSKEEALSYGKLLSTRSNRLGFIDVQTEKELKALLSFLEAL